MEILIKRDRHKVHDLKRKYGCKCPNCGTVFSFQKNESMYLGNYSGRPNFYIIACPNCCKIIDLTACTWISSPEDVTKFLELHK